MKELRILSGKYKGVKLVSPNLKTTHPMGSREKLALFNMLASYLEGARVLDYFAGSGALGLEAISRGADSVTFVENNPKAMKVIKENVARLECTKGTTSSLSSESLPGNLGGTPQIGRSCTFCQGGQTHCSENPLLQEPPFSVIISDPPYDHYQVPDYASLLADGGVLALSHPSSFDPKTITGLTLLKTNRYATCNISLFTK